MDRALFLARLGECAAATRAAAQDLVIAPLPGEVEFHLSRGLSREPRPFRDFLIYDADHDIERLRSLKFLRPENVAEYLWRDPRVPQWIDAAVVGETGRSTLVELTFCGRFIAEEQRLYHLREGRAPFHAGGIAAHPMPEHGDRFSAYTRVACWRPEDLARARLFSNDVWSLGVCGPDFSDEALGHALDFPHAEILELRSTAISGRGLAALADMVRLRILRITCGDIDCLDLRHVPPLPHLEELTIERRPRDLHGEGQLTARCPNLREFELR
jgi:hypothetical protein